MIINRSHNFVFVHVPKAAGTSLCELLTRYARLGDAEIGGTSYGEQSHGVWEQRFGLHKHSTAADAKRTLGEEYPRFFSFAFVRNPYARAYSLYRFQTKWVEGAHYAAIAQMRFEDYVFSEFFSNHSDGLSAQQTTWTHDNEAQIVDHVGQVERLRSSLLLILSIIERKPVPSSLLESLYVLNDSGDPDAWKTNVTGDAKRHIATIYGPDFQNFGYEP